jgi:hypothetical protein
MQSNAKQCNEIDAKKAMQCNVQRCKTGDNAYAKQCDQSDLKLLKSNAKKAM